MDPPFQKQILLFHVAVVLHLLSLHLDVVVDDDALPLAVLLMLIVVAVADEVDGEDETVADTIDDADVVEDVGEKVVAGQ